MDRMCGFSVAHTVLVLSSPMTKLPPQQYIPYMYTAMPAVREIYILPSCGHATWWYSVPGWSIRAYKPVNPGLYGVVRNHKYIQPSGFVCTYLWLLTRAPYSPAWGVLTIT